MTGNGCGRQAVGEKIKRRRAVYDVSLPLIREFQRSNKFSVAETFLGLAGRYRSGRNRTIALPGADSQKVFMAKAIFNWAAKAINQVGGLVEVTWTLAGGPTKTEKYGMQRNYVG